MRASTLTKYRVIFFLYKSHFKLSFSSKMENSFPSVCTFIAFFFLLLVSARSDVIQDSCDKAAKGDRNINFDFCVASLEGNPKSKTAASTESLVPISIEMAISNATSISSIISKLLENKNLDKFTRSCLEDCAELYSDAQPSLETGGQAVESKDYGTAKTVISAALDAPVTCEDGFKEREGLVSPLTKENDEFFQLTVVPLAFINMLN
ncbi:putative invertase inhibitor [Herrania umbratica]|uniref:Invertase inhibitor n=1 Tax=Herrania umbratica TaxID=108875 RepID=A0A6J1AIQ5_9ROSI|nr:putative invertase inhibitor [Herrania umbratica]